MIERPTVLVLGAGASAPYGFPVGDKLRELILQKSDSIDKFAFRHSYNPEEEGDKFRDQFRKSRSRSIDAFLEHRKDNDSIAGKRLIAARIAQFEGYESLREPRNINKSPREPEKDVDWLALLFDFMRCDGREENIKQNRLTVVTFNYDRSFEFAFFEHLCNQYQLAPCIAARIVREWPIYHVHGSIGDCRFPGTGDESGRPYMASLDYLDEVENRMFIVHDEQKENRGLEQARIALFGAEKVFFLGFSFHPLNCQRLFRGQRSASSIWWACSHGMTRADQNVANRRAAAVDSPAASAHGAGIIFDKHGGDAYQFLRENYEFLIS